MGFRPVVVGTACCLFSAVAYTASHICLRQLAALGTDPAWAMCGKDLVAVIVLGPWLLTLRISGRPVLPSPRTLLVLVLVGIAAQFGGNLIVQWSYGVIGLALTVPAVMGGVLVGGALTARGRLGEPITGRSLRAIVVLIAAALLLSLGADNARLVIAASLVLSSPTHGAVGVLVAFVAGCVFGATSTMIRETVRGTTRADAVAAVICAVGVVGLGALSVHRLGLTGISRTTPSQIAWMTGAGLANLAAFLGLIVGLRWTTVLRANVLNATQVAMAAVAGVVLFGEPTGTWLAVGVCLTILGVLWTDQTSDVPTAHSDDPAAD